MKKTILFLILSVAALFPANVPAQQVVYGQRVVKPRLVVNIVVGGMRYDYLDKFAAGFSKTGFRRFADQGMVFTESRYDFMQTVTPATLATLTTGANPSVHGVVGRTWYDYITGQPVDLIRDPSAVKLAEERSRGYYSNLNLTAPTLGDGLKGEKPGSKVVTIAADPVSAIAMGGANSHVYWLDPDDFVWASSSAYMPYLPGWVQQHNQMMRNRRPGYAKHEWVAGYKKQGYVNSRYSLFDFKEARYKHIRYLGNDPSVLTQYSPVLCTPLANDLVADFVQQAFINEGLGKDDDVDILNIYFDAPRLAGEKYGPESVELEDMYYCLDRTISQLIDFVNGYIRDDAVLYVLTSDHGTSDSYDAVEPTRQRFNPGQFAMLVSTFIGSQYGGQDWVAGYEDRRLYLNRKNIYSERMNIVEVQEMVSTFVLQFRGISHAITANAMQGASFADEYLRKIQNGFYPRRSGDIAINLMPGWIEESNYARSSPGSLYDYDTHVPLMVMGCGLRHAVVDTEVDMCQLPVSLARIMGVNRPVAATAGPIRELVEKF